MRPLALILVLLVLVSCLSGCGASASATPEEAALRSQGLPLNQVQILTTRNFGDLTVVVFRSFVPGGAGQQAMEGVGYAVVRRSLFGWQPGNGGSTSSPAPLRPAQVLQVGGALPPGGGGEPEIVYGRALEPTVAVVKLIYTDGHTASDTVTNGAFVFLTTGPAQICSIRALDAQGQEFPLPPEVMVPFPGCP